MFKQLSQIGKNLSDEFAKGLSEDLNGGQEPVVDDKSGLPQDVQLKLRKFEKYEEKYPRLLAAYKNDKLKLEKINATQKVLAENTPVSNIEDVESLEAFFRDVNEKQKMLNDEIKRLVTSGKAAAETVDSTAPDAIGTSGEDQKKTVQAETASDELKQGQMTEISELRDALVKTEGEFKELQERYEELRRQREQEVNDLHGKISEAQEKLEEDARIHKEETVQLKKDLSEAEELVKSRDSSIEELKTQVSAGEQEVQKLNRLLAERPTMMNTGTPKTTGKNKRKGKKKKGNSGTVGTAIVSKVAEEEESEDLKSPTEVEELKNAKVRVVELETKCTSLESQVTSLKHIEADLRTELENSNSEHDKLRDDLKKKELELEEVRDMLRDVGNELVDAKEQLKNTSDSENEKIQSLVSEKDNLRSQFEAEKQKLSATISQLNDQVSSTSAKLASQQNETNVAERKSSKLNESLSKMKVENTTLKEQINETSKNLKTLRISVSQKEKTITYLEQQVKEYNESSSVSKKANESLKKENDNLSKRLDSLRLENENIHNEMKKNAASFETHIRENGKLSERLTILQEKYEALQSIKSNSSEQVDSIKRQCEELSSKLREANKRIMSLEEEVNDYTDAIQEKTREVNSMRRLLSESSHDESTKLGEYQEKLAAVLDEKTRLENELSLQVSRRVRETQDWKQANNELKSEIHGLKLQEKELKAEITSLSTLTEKMQRKSSTFADDSNDMERVTANLKESLSKADNNIRVLQEANENLMHTNDDVNKKLDRLSKNYRTLMNQMTALKEEKNEVSTRSSRSSSVASLSGTQTPQSEMRRSHSFVKDNSVVESHNEVNEKIAYIKNVLLGFLEHKDQRNQLLPVVSMLLQLDSKDEKRLLMSIK